MLLIAAKNEKNVFILSEIENGAILLIYIAAGCKCGFPLIGTSDHWGDLTPYWIAWGLYLIGAILITFDISRTVCITSTAISISYFWGIVTQQYEWNEILFWGTWQSALQKKRYVYLSTKSPKHILLFESIKQCHLQYSKELFALVSLLKNGNAYLDFKTERVTDKKLSINRRYYYAIRFIGTSIFVLFSLVIMFSNSFTVWCVIVIMGLVVFTFYQLTSEPVLSKLEAEYYNDFIAYQLSQ